MLAASERMRLSTESFANVLSAWAFLLNPILLDQKCFPGFSIVTPRERDRRGAQLSIRVPHNGRELCKRLTQEGIVGDWREPDTYRVAPVPLYNSYHDVFRFAQRFAAVSG